MSVRRTLNDNKTLLRTNVLHFRELEKSKIEAAQKELKELLEDSQAGVVGRKQTHETTSETEETKFLDTNFAYEMEDLKFASRLIQRQLEGITTSTEAILNTVSSVKDLADRLSGKPAKSTIKHLHKSINLKKKSKQKYGRGDNDEGTLLKLDFLNNKIEKNEATIIADTGATEHIVNGKIKLWNF